MNDRGDDLADLFHLGFFHPARRQGRGSETNSRCDERFVCVERDRVLVNRDLNVVEGLLRNLAGNSLSIHEHINEQQMVVGTARHQTQSGA